MNIVIFGSSGFLGRAVVNQLREVGASVHTVSRAGGGGDLRADLADPSSLEKLEIAPEVVINLAARVPVGSDTLADSAQMFAVNAVGAATVARWAAARRARRLIQGSTLVVATRPWPVPLTESAATYPTGPATGYAASKLGGELVAGAIARAANVSFCALRFSALYGPGMAWTGILSAFLDRALDGRRPQASTGGHADFLHVQDAARAVRAAVTHQAEGVINVASGVETSFVDLARLVLVACARAPDEVDLTDGPISRAAVDVARLQRELGWSSGTTLEEGIAELVGLRKGHT